MAHDVRQWPGSVYPGEVESECPEAREVIDALIWNLKLQGPAPAGYQVKTLGAKLASRLMPLIWMMRGRPSENTVPATERSIVSVFTIRRM